MLAKQVLYQLSYVPVLRGLDLGLQVLPENPLSTPLTEHVLPAARHKEFGWKA